MADTVNVGAVAVEILANTSGLSQGMANAKKTVDQFSNGASGSLQKFQQSLTQSKISNEGVKKSITAVASAAGVQSAAIGNAAEAMLSIGGPIGVAVAALSLLKAAWDASTAAAKEAAEFQARRFDIMKGFAVTMGTDKAENSVSAGVLEKVKAISAEQDKIIKELEAGIFSKDERDMKHGQVRGFRAMINQLNAVRETLKPLDKVMQDFTSRDFGIKLTLEPGTAERLKAELENEMAKSRGMAPIVANLPQGGPEHQQMLSQWREAEVKIAEIQREITKATQEHGNSWIRKMLDAAKGQAALERKKWKEEGDVRKFFDSPYSDKKMGGAIGFVQNFRNMAEKLKNMKVMNLGFGKQLSDVSAETLMAGAKQVQKVEDPQLAKSNALLTDIKNRLPTGGGATTV